MGSSSLIKERLSRQTRSQTRLNQKEQDHKSDMEVFMSYLLVLIMSLFLFSCSTFQFSASEKIHYPGQQDDRHLDDFSRRDGFFNR
jgi:hypothetical protein